MAENFIEVEIETDEQALADKAIEYLQEQWEDWEPNEGDLEVVLVEALAQMAQNAAETAAVVPGEAFEAILEELYAVHRLEGVPATGTVTFTLLDTDPHVIDAGTEVDIDGWAFITDDDIDTVGTLTIAGVPVTAAEIDLMTNGLVGDQVAMITATSFIATVTLDAPTGGATEGETDEAYRDRGSRALELQAKTLVTGRDYELMALTEGTGVERVSVVANQATRQITVTSSKMDGTALNATEKTNLLALFNTYRQTTWQVLLQDPTVTTINVAYSIHVFPGFEPVGVMEEITMLLGQVLDPARWNTPQYAPPPATTWTIEPRVRKNKIIDVIGNAHGVDYVIDVTLSGSAGSLQGNGDWLMPGAVPLPRLGTTTGAVA